MVNAQVPQVMAFYYILARLFCVFLIFVVLPVRVGVGNQLAF